MSARAAVKRLAADLGILILSLFLGYNTYKEIMSSLSPLTMELRGELKGSFPEALLIFAACSILARQFLKIKALGSWLLPLLYGIAVNAFFYPEGGHYLFLHSIAIVYFVILSSAAAYLSRLGPGAWAGKGVSGGALERFAADPSSAFFALFFISMASCGALVVFEHDDAARKVADVSYFLLLAGLATELYDPKRGKG